jgi:hypothetical protein
MVVVNANAKSTRNEFLFMGGSYELLSVNQVDVVKGGTPHELN